MFNELHLHKFDLHDLHDQTEMQYMGTWTNGEKHQSSQSSSLRVNVAKSYVVFDIISILFGPWTIQLRERERERVRGMAGNDDEMDRLDLEDETDRLQLVTGSS